MDESLDISFLSGLLSRAQRFEQSAISMTNSHISLNSGYVSLSGGKDSVVVAHMARTIQPDIPMCFFSSDLEYPENIDYINKLAEKWSLNLHIINASESILWIFTEIGWFDHWREGRDIGVDVHEAKISDPSRQAHDRFGPGRLWGLRCAESASRRQLLTPGKGTHRYKDGRVATSPIWNWQDNDVKAYISRHKIPLNPIYEKLTELGVPTDHQRVGSFFDGANLDSGRMTWLKRGWPDLYDMMRNNMPRLEEYR